LAVLDSLLAERREQLGRALDLYLAGDFPKELLTERQARLEKTISGLERERADLTRRLDADEMTNIQIMTLQELVARVGTGIQVAEAGFAAKRGVVEALDVWATLSVEDGQRVVLGRCVSGEKTFDLHSARELI
jgi:hypothetical protein